MNLADRYSFCERVGSHIFGIDPNNRNLPISIYLLQPVFANINMSELRIDVRIGLDYSNCLGVVKLKS